VPVSDDDLAAGHRALDCYETYRPVIEEHQPLRSVRDGVSFELFGETPSSRLSVLLGGLEDGADPLSAFGSSRS
jgi:hypothetical protein